LQIQDLPTTNTLAYFATTLVEVYKMFNDIDTIVLKSESIQLNVTLI